MYICVFRQCSYTYILSAHLENKHISPIYPYHVLGDYSEILSAYPENTQKSFTRITGKSEYAVRISAYYPITQKGYQRILALCTYLSVHSPSSPTYFSVFSYHTDQCKF